MVMWIVDCGDGFFFCWLVFGWVDGIVVRCVFYDGIGDG